MSTNTIKGAFSQEDTPQQPEEKDAQLAKTEASQKVLLQQMCQHKRKRL